MADAGDFDVVTGAFGYTGRHIARRLLAFGRRVRTITGHLGRPKDFGDNVEIAPMNFDHPGELIRSLQGASVLYNTYWVRFDYGQTTFERAVANSKTLIEAARDAGVRRIVHLSIANPALDSPLPYYSGKARVEKHLVDSGIAYSILRPTVIFGPEDILINNIAWFTRRFPVFAIPGNGRYELQPIFVEDLADIAVQASHSNGNQVLDTAGPETFTFDELVRRIAQALGRSPKLVHVGPRTALRTLQLVGRVLGDVILTPQEIEGLMANLLVSKSPPLGATRFTEWLSRNASTVGGRYTSELQRHYR